MPCISSGIEWTFLPFLRFYFALTRRLWLFHKYVFVAHSLTLFAANRTHTNFVCCLNVDASRFLSANYLYTRADFDNCACVNFGFSLCCSDLMCCVLIVAFCLKIGCQEIPNHLKWRNTSPFTKFIGIGWFYYWHCHCHYNSAPSLFLFISFIAANGNHCAIVKIQKSRNEWLKK